VSRRNRSHGGAVRGGVGFTLCDSGGVGTVRFAIVYLHDSGEGEKSHRARALEQSRRRGGGGAWL
jgi:hypothetical protein